MHIARARTLCDTHIRCTRTLSRVYQRYTSAGSLLPAVCGSAVSHTRCYSCVTNACIRSPWTSARAQENRGATIRAHTDYRDGKCSQCTNLRRSSLERGRPALGHIYTRAYVCAPTRSARARPSGAKPRKLIYLGRAFLSFLLLVHFAVFSSCVRMRESAYEAFRVSLRTGQL